MELIISALVLGLLGSFHCVGMCGPIALSIPLGTKNIRHKLMGGSLYNFGRTVTYGLMGAFFGLIGQGFEMAGFQKWISIGMGTLMVLSVLMPSLFNKLNTGHGIPYAGAVRKGIQKLFKQRSFFGLFIIGLLNGLLPCGLVYMAIAGAIGAANIYQGILFMILFGLGTFPMMLAISMAGNMVSLAIRNRVNKLIPVVVVLIGVIFILRGLSLGIPFLSPPEKKLNPEFHKEKMEQTSSKDAVKGSCCEHKNH